MLHYVPRRRWALQRTRVVPRCILKTWQSLGLATQKLHAKTRIFVPVPGPSAPGATKPAWSRDPSEGTCNPSAFSSIKLLPSGKSPLAKILTVFAEQIVAYIFLGIKAAFLLPREMSEPGTTPAEAACPIAYSCPFSRCYALYAAARARLLGDVWVSDMHQSSLWWKFRHTKHCCSAGGPPRIAESSQPED